MNMFKPSKAKTNKEYIVNVAEDRKKIIVFLDKFIKKTVPSLKPYFANNMLGYGKFPYKNYKNEVLDWPVIGLASQKGYVSIYVCAVADKMYVAEKFKKELGKVSVGKSCISFKKLEDIDLKTLAKVFKEAEKNPGLVSTKQKTKEKIKR